MYKIVGADGRQYGPVDADQIRRWVSEGRVNANTSILAEGATEWKPLSAFPEFTTAPPPGAAASFSAAGGPDAIAFAEEIRGNDYQLQIGSCFSRGWSLVMSRFWLCIGASFVVFMLAWMAWTSFVLGLLVAYVLYGGLDWMFLKMLRGQPVSFGDAFAGFTISFIPLMLFSLVSQSLTLVGLLLCVLPGIYLTIVWGLFPPLLILDKGFDFWPAMEVSRKVVNRHFWKILLFAITGALLLLAGLLCLVVGFFVVLPVVVAATVYAYEDIFGARKVEQSFTPVPPSPLTPAAET